MAELTLLLLTDHRPWQMTEVEVNLALPEPFTLLGNPVLPPVNSNLLHIISRFMSVLVLAGIKLIFFIAASMGLWFGFVLKTALIMQGCFRYC